MDIRLRGLMCCAFILSVFATVGEADSSGVMKTKLLDNATDRDVEKMCDAYREDAREIIKGNCTLDALVTAKDEAECDAIQARCKESIDKAAIDSEECTHMTAADFAGCRVMVGEVEKCFKQLVDYARGLSCELFGDELPAPPRCVEALQEKCPGNP